MKTIEQDEIVQENGEWFTATVRVFLKGSRVVNKELVEAHEGPFSTIEEAERAFYEQT